MDILQIFKDKLNELGEEKVCQSLELPKQIIRQFVTGKKSPSHKTCQRILDLWNVDSEPVGDGSTASWTIDEEGITNGEYCPPEWGRKKAAWPNRDVCLCLPAYKDIPQAHFFVMMALVAKYRMGIRINFRGDDSMITRSRNHLAKRFLDTGASWSIWFDSDMVFPMGHAGVYATMTGMRSVAEKFMGLHTIERLISWDKTVVGGCYWDRRGGGKLIAGGNTPMQAIPNDTLQAIIFNGTGCLAVHRKVFLDIAEKFPETMHSDSLGNECGFFTNIQTPQRMLGEDESFAKRATEAGHPTYLDLGILCGHMGSGNIHGLPEKGSKI